MKGLGLVLVVLFLLDALRLRQRCAAFQALALDAPQTADAAYDLVTAPGVILPAAAKRAAVALAQTQGLEVVELVPARLPAFAALSLVRMVNPLHYRAARFGPAHTTGHALLVHRNVLQRAAVSAGEVADPVAFMKAATRLKRYACTTTDVAIVPGWEGVPEALKWRRAVLQAAGVGKDMVALLAPPVMITLLAWSAIVAPLWGALALVAYHVQPGLILGRQRLCPPDLWQLALGRLPLEVWRWLWMLYGQQSPASRRDAVAARRPVYTALLAGGVEPFFEPRRLTCPLCGSGELKLQVRMPDLWQHKPGHFALERCGSCGHIFQNPRLTAAGLDFYYKDFYDGLGEEISEFIFGLNPDGYLARARVLTGRTEPRRWLDVGTGFGHFCCAARQVWPKTRFDGVDLSAGIDEGVRRGWIDTAYRGPFPELAPQLAGHYDAVSMFHYLEHTRDPQTELHAAGQVLRDTGYLLVEVPDPASRMGRLLGRFWPPWLQPQHQHLLSVENLDKLLRQHGFEPVMWQRGEVHQPADFVLATIMLVGMIARNPDRPWRPPASRWARWRYALVWTLGVPFVLLASTLDLLLRPVCRRPGLANAYRVLARRRQDPLVSR